MSDTAVTAQPATMTINSQALGPLEVDPADAIEFVDPVAGFTFGPTGSRTPRSPGCRPSRPPSTRS
jgi:hypothetical protein